MTTSREQAIEDYKRAGRGEVDVHIWKSYNHDGVFMKTVTVEPVGAPLPAEDVYDPGRDITLEWEVYYAGVMEPAEAAEHARAMEFSDMLESELL